MASKEVQAMRDLIDYYKELSKSSGEAPGSGGQYELLYKQLENTLASKEDAIKMGHLETASGLNLPQAKSGKFGQKITPMNVAQLNKMFTNNPMALGGATFAPVGKSLFPWRDEEDPIEKRSPYWNLFGYNV